MKFLLCAILFVLLFGGLGVLILGAVVVENIGPIVLLVLVYVFRDQIKAGVERLTGAGS